ncbi:MAG: hypothetical protein ACI8RD_014416 [Bacillariaceae sp.]|jgi:hypothetical protein
MDFYVIFDAEYSKSEIPFASQENKKILCDSGDDLKKYIIPQEIER